MDTTQDIERRLTELEIKASFADDMLEQLNQIIVRQQQQMERLARELADLRQQHSPKAPPSAACATNCRRTTDRPVPARPRHACALPDGPVRLIPARFPPIRASAGMSGGLRTPHGRHR